MVRTFAMPLPPPPSPSQSTSMPPASGKGKRDADIVVIPDKFYGVALKMDPLTQADQQLPPTPPPVAKPVVAPVATPREEKRSALPLVIAVILVILLLAGGFVYFARDLLFPAPATPVTPTPVVKQAPAAPTGLTVAASGSTAASLVWTDVAQDEAGYRIERKEGEGTFVPVTNLAANSTAFLDVTAMAGKSYSYRVVAVNDGGDSPASNEASVTLPDLEAPAPVGPTLPPGGLDSDSDGLSDMEENLFGTDAHKPDSDDDKFLDGNEVFHLYNPQVKAPSRLLESDLVKVLTSPVGWTMFVPSKWTSSMDTPDGSRATLTAESSEVFSMSVQDNPEKQALLDWYLARNPGTVSTDIRPFTSKGGLEGIFSPDRLSAYFAWEGKVFVLQYNLGTQKFVNYRTTFEMMLNSLTLNGAPKVQVDLNPATTGPGTLIGTSTSTETAATSTETAPTSIEPAPEPETATTTTETASSTSETTTSTTTTQP